jgi:hypothetical protein
MKVFVHVFLIVFIISSMTAFHGCRLGKDGDTPPMAVLGISGVSPGEVLSHTSFIVVVSGQGFNEHSVIVFNEQPVETNYLNPQTLNATIDADRTAFSLDPAKVEVPVWVINRDPVTGGTLAESGRLTLTVWSMPAFSAPKALYQIPPGITDTFISHLQLKVDEDNRFFLLWRETTYDENYWPSLKTKLLISSDGGETWGNILEIPVTQALFSRNGVLYIFPHNDAMADERMKYYYSLDNGLTWETVVIADLRSGQEFNGYQVCMDGNGRFILVYAQTNKYDRVRLTTMHSTKSGRTWNKIGESVTPYYPNEEDYLYGFHLDWMVVNDAGGMVLGVLYDSKIPVAFSRVYKSSDAGEHITEYTSGLAERTIYNFGGGYLSPEGTLFAAFTDNVWYRLFETAFFRGGGMGEQTANLLFFDSGYGLHNMVRDTDGNMYVFDGLFISRSIDGGDEWSTPLELAPDYAGTGSAAFDNQWNLHLARFTDKKEVILIRSK